MAVISIGCSGWNYESWRGELYPSDLPARRWLERYAESFDTVEVNSTFYRLASPKGVEGWIAQTSPDFVFSLKASRFLTHVKRLRDIADGVRRFYEPIEPIRAAGRLGPILWQLPESFPLDEDRLRETLELLPAGRHAFEFRHRSWFTARVYELLASHGAALVLGDHPERPFQTAKGTADWRYLRMHYGHRGRRGNYSVHELEHWARRVRGWAGKGDVYVYFNNDWEAFAPKNAATMKRLLGVGAPAGRRAAGVPGG